MCGFIIFRLGTDCPNWALCCVLGTTLYPHSASLHPRVSTGTGEFNAGGNPAMD